jgi:hypothetical protein
LTVGDAARFSAPIVPGTAMYIQPPVAPLQSAAVPEPGTIALLTAAALLAAFAVWRRRRH